MFKTLETEILIRQLELYCLCNTPNCKCNILKGPRVSVRNSFETPIMYFPVNLAMNVKSINLETLQIGGLYKVIRLEPKHIIRLIVTQTVL